MHRGILEVYLLELSALQAAVGSRDPGLRARVGKGNPLPDEADEFEAGCSHDPATLAAIDGTLRDLIDSPGRCVPSPSVGFALRRLCRVLGEALEAGLFYDVSFAYLEQVSIVLPLAQRRLPLNLPSWAGDPRCGYLTHQECTERLEEGEPSHEEQIVRAGIEEVWEWMEAASHEGKDLIGFWC